MASTAEMSEIYTEVVADTSGCQKVLRRCRNAERFKLDIPVSDRAGGSAVKVLRHSGELVGHLQQEVAVKVVSEVAKGRTVEAFALLVTDGALYSKRKNQWRLFSQRPRHCYVKIQLAKAEDESRPETKNQEN